MPLLTGMRRRCQGDLLIGKAHGLGGPARDTRNELKCLTCRPKVRDRRRITKLREGFAFPVDDRQMSGVNGLDRIAANDVGQNLSGHRESLAADDADDAGINRSDQFLFICVLCVICG
jgi:hypothetical protein